MLTGQPQDVMVVIQRLIESSSCTDKRRTRVGKLTCLLFWWLGKGVARAGGWLERVAKTLYLPRSCTIL